MNSQFAISPFFTISPRPSTMCVCGVIGYAQITSGRQSATASAIAWEPSICLSMRALAFDDADRCVEGSVRGGDVRFRDLAGEFLANRGGYRLDRHAPRERGERAKQRRIRQWPSDVRER